MRRIVILGTGTEVGKTYAAVRLLEAAASVHDSCLGLKPIETGVQPAPAPAPGSDAAALEAVGFHVKPPRPHPYFAWHEPISPHLAAAAAGRVLALADVVAWIAAAERLAATSLALSVIETAGGAFSPLGPSTTNLSLARSLEPATLVLATPNRLGVLHDTTATVIAMQHQHRPPDALLLTAPSPPDASTASNARELARLCPNTTLLDVSDRAALTGFARNPTS